MNTKIKITDNYKFWIFILIIVATLYVSLPLIFNNKWKELIIVLLICPPSFYMVIKYSLKKRDELKNKV